MSGWEPLTVVGRRGAVPMRVSVPEGAGAGVVMAGGVGGGFDSPARDLYGRLSAELHEAGVAAVRLAYRKPADLDEAVADVLVAVGLLVDRGVRGIGLVGHSLGGAVVLRAAVAEERVRAVVTLASQSYGAEPAGALGDRSLLVVHGGQDRVLPARCSQWIHRIAGEPKQLVIYDGAGHGLDEVAEELHGLVRSWLLEVLRPAVDGETGPGQGDPPGG